MAAITNTGLLFHPHQVFWPFGIPATPEFIAGGHGTTHRVRRGSRR